MLYPLTVFSEANDDDFYEMDSSALFAFPFTLEEGAAINLVLTHTGVGRQDHSVRAWVSTENGGEPVVQTPVNVSYWHPNRLANEIITVYDRGMDAPNANAQLPLEPGDYVLNVLNLVNTPNSFTYVLTDFE